MASLRAQLQRRAALRRAIPAKEVDIEEIQRFWLSLNSDLRQEFLCFDEASLVAKLHAHMTSLCKSEIWCRRNVLGGLLPRASSSSGAEGDEVGERLRGFAFECPAERDCIGRQMGPISFCVLEEVAGRDDIFEELQRRLGSPFLQGRPVLIEKDWHVVAEEKTPQNWKDLQVIAYRLVELAIFQAYKDAKDHAKEREAAKLQAQADEALAAELEGRPAKTAAAAAATATATATATPSTSKKKAKKNKGSSKRESESGVKVDHQSSDVVDGPAEDEACKNDDDEAERRMSTETKASELGRAPSDCGTEEGEGELERHEEGLPRLGSSKEDEEEATTHSGDEDDRKEPEHEHVEEEEEEEECHSRREAQQQQQQEQAFEAQEEPIQCDGSQPSLRKTVSGLSGEQSSRRWHTWLRMLSREDGQWTFTDPSAVATSLVGQHAPPESTSDDAQQRRQQQITADSDEAGAAAHHLADQGEHRGPSRAAPRRDASLAAGGAPAFRAVVKNTFLSLDFVNDEDRQGEDPAQARERHRRSCFF